MDAVPETWFDAQLYGAEVPDDVVFREFGGEMIILNIASGQYHSIDAVGSRFYAALRDAPRVSEATARLEQEFGQPADRIRADLMAFCNSLVARGLLRLVPPRG